MLMCGTPYRLSLTLLFLKLYLILLPIFMKIHWGMRWSCFCFLAKNHLILKVLEKTQQEENSTAQRMAENRREMNAFQSPSCIFLALIGGGLVFYFFSAWLPPGAPIFLQAFWKAIPASPARMFAPFSDPALLWSLYVCVLLRLTLCHPRDYSPPGSSVNGISKGRILGCHFLLQGILIKPTISGCPAF